MTATERRIKEIEVRRHVDTNPDLSYLEADSGRYSDIEDAEKLERADRERLADYGNGWEMLGIDAAAIVYVKGTVQVIESGGLWGIESDSDPRYLLEIEDEQLAELENILVELGFSREAIRQAIDEATR